MIRQRIDIWYVTWPKAFRWAPAAVQRLICRTRGHEEAWDYSANHGRGVCRWCGIVLPWWREPCGCLSDPQP